MRPESEGYPSIVAIEPAADAGVDVLDRMPSTFGDENFVTCFHDDGFAIHGHGQPAFDNGDKLIGGMDKIVPFLAGWINKEITAEALALPVFGHPDAIDGGGKFSFGENVS